MQHVLSHPHHLKLLLVAVFYHSNNPQTDKRTLKISLLLKPGNKERAVEG